MERREEARGQERGWRQWRWRRRRRQGRWVVAGLEVPQWLRHLHGQRGSISQPAQSRLTLPRGRFAFVTQTLGHRALGTGCSTNTRQMTEGENRGPAQASPGAAAVTRTEPFSRCLDPGPHSTLGTLGGGSGTILTVMTKNSVREMELQAQGHEAGKWRRRDWSPSV